MFLQQRKINKLLDEIQKNSQKAIRSNFAIDTTEDNLNCYLELTQLGYEKAYLEVADHAFLLIQKKNDKFYQLALEYSWLAYEKGYIHALIIRAETQIWGCHNFVERPLEEIIAEEHEIEKDLLFVLSKNMPIDYAVRARKALLRLYGAKDLNENKYYQAYWRYMLYYEFKDVHQVPDVQREAFEWLKEYNQYVNNNSLNISSEMLYKWENEPYPNFNNL